MSQKKTPRRPEQTHDDNHIDQVKSEPPAEYHVQPAATSSTEQHKVEAETPSERSSAAAPDADNETTGARATAHNKGATANNSSNKLTLAALGIAVIALLGTGASAIYSQQQLSALQQTLDRDPWAVSISENKGQLERHIGELRSALDQRTQGYDQRFNNLAADAKLISEQLDNVNLKLSESVVRHPANWLLAEANYLFNLAGSRLYIEHDVIGAINLLQTADQRIMEMNDPSLLPLRKALSQDIAQLQALPEVDRDGIQLKLASLAGQIDSLTLAGPRIPAKDEQQGLSDNPADWQDNLGKSFKSLMDGFITVRRLDGAIEPLIAPEHEWYLRENIKTRLLQAQMAVARGDQQNYQQALSQAQQWLNRYFDQNQHGSTFINQQLEQLLTLDVHIPAPTQLTAKAQLAAAIEQRQTTLSSQ